MTVHVLSTKPVRLARTYRSWAELHYRTYMELRRRDPEQAEFHKQCSIDCYARADEKVDDELIAMHEAMI